MVHADAVSLKVVGSAADIRRFGFVQVKRMLGIVIGPQHFKFPVYIHWEPLPVAAVTIK